MTKKSAIVIGSVLLLTLLLSGCQLPASKAPETPTSAAMTTPILIQTDSPEIMTQTTAAKGAKTQAETSAPQTTHTNTSEPTKTVVVPTVTRPAEYTLHEGEFPYCIARRFNLNIEDLINLNNIDPNEVLSPGTVLQIPQTGTWQGEGRVLRPHPTTHTVSSGETIYSIACYYGDVSPEAIIAVNGLEEPYDLSTGQKLNIP
jgi:LysM repeat protein